MLALSPKKIVGAILIFFISLLGIRHTFYFLQQSQNGNSFAYETELLFDSNFPLLRWMERADYDVHLRALDTRRINPNVAIVEINERSVNEIGQFPFARKIYGQLMEKLEAAGAKVVAFDMFFSESERNETLREMRNVRRQIESSLGNSPALRLIDDQLKGLDGDQVFANAIASSKMPTVVGFAFAGGEVERKKNGAQDGLLQKHSIRASQVNSDNFGLDLSYRQPIYPNSDILGMVPPRSLGHILPSPDTDSVIRTVPAVIQFDGAFYTSLAVQAVSKYIGHDIGVEKDDGFWLRDGRRQVDTPLSGNGYLVRFYGGAREFPFYEFVDVINGKVPASELKGKIIFVGATAMGLKDIRANPFGNHYPGVEVHATVASNMLNGDYLVRDGRYFYLGYFFLLALGLSISVIVYRVHPIVAFGFTMAAVVLIQYVTQKLFFDRGVVVPSFLPSLALITIFFTGIIYRYFTGEKEKRFVRTAFSRYVSGAVVEEILKDQSKLQLGGQKKELTVMFSDLAGFTKLSEHLDAAFVTQLLNEYFSRMTDIILRNHGTLDKYMGDGIMCFWGAPLDLPEHATHACRAALEMAEELQRMNGEWKQKHGFSVSMRIGVHTGDMAVGNMGSDKVFSYTVMGDNVNLCSRLEGVNTVYGTTIIVSDDTAIRAGEKFLFRALDVVRVKGKEEEVRVFELLARKEEAAQHEEWMRAFALGLQAYQAGAWDEAEESFGAALALRPQDAPAKAFISRVQELRKSQPADWNGVWKLSSK